MKTRIPSILLASLITGSVAQAQFFDDFESYIPPADGAWGASAFSQNGGQSIAFQGTIDVGGAPSQVMGFNVDFSGVAGTDSFWGANISNQTGIAFGTTTNYADYTFSFDLWVDDSGGSGTEVSNAVQVKVRNGNQFQDGTLQTTVTPTVGGSYQSFSFGFDELTPFGSNGTYDPTSTVNNIIFEIGKAWGNDAGNRMRIDNVGITFVPEPQAYALLSGIMALGFIMVRRRT